MLTFSKPVLSFAVPLIVNNDFTNGVSGHVMPDVGSVVSGFKVVVLADRLTEASLEEFHTDQL